MEGEGLALAGKYQFTKQLGSGEFGVIRKGENVLTKKKVAIKIISKCRVKELKGEQQFLSLSREVNIMKLCHHPHIVRHIDTFEDDQNYYIIMEYVKFGDLYQFIKEKVREKGRLKEEHARIIFAQLVSAIEYCHANLITHRDIKLENILISDKKRLQVKLSDFGFANFIKVDTLHDTFCGSLHYSAPEIILNERYQPMPVDIWSAGVVLYTMISGTFPWNDKLIGENILARNMNWRLELPAYFSSDVKDLLTRIFVPANERITITQIKTHPWMGKSVLPSYLLPRKTITQIDIIIVEKIISLGFNKSDILSAVFDNKDTIENALYHILLDKLTPNTPSKLNLADLIDANFFSGSDPNLHSKMKYSPITKERKYSSRIEHK